MNSIADTLRTLGHVARRETLLSAGISRRQLEAAVFRGQLSRPIRGWYATPLADVDQLRAVAAGARIGCVSALRRWGVWSGEGDILHLQVAPSRSLLDTRGVAFQGSELRVPHPSVPPELDVAVRQCVLGTPVGHWVPPLDRARALDWIVSPLDALAQAVRCQREEHAVACVDSALHEGVISGEEWESICEALPRRLHRLHGRRDPRADSGNETITRLRLVDLGLRCEPQVHLPGIGFVDLLVEGLVPLEIDSEAHHSSPDQRRKDRSRSLLSAALGAPSLRIGSEHLTAAEWPLVVAAIRQQLADARALEASGRRLGWG